MNASRRTILLGALGAASGLAGLPARAAAPATFESLFAQAELDPDSLEQARHESELGEFGRFKAVRPNIAPSKRKVADEARRLIVLFEVTNEKLYTAKYQQAVWPGGQSGATIGVGYDVGYANQERLRKDWTDYLDADLVKRLEIACETKGKPAKGLIAGLRDVKVPWSAANKQFNERLLPLYVATTLNALPLADALSDKSLGALVSLVYNRGPSFSKTTDRYKEMNAIKRALEAQNYASIPCLIRKMTRLWDAKKFKGLHTRRYLEAALFEEGLT